MASFEIELSILKQDHRLIAGVDEAGRGSLFGPVVAAAVILPAGWLSRPVRGWLAQVNDSKLLLPAKRRVLAGHILTGAVAVGLGFATNREIDDKNIYWASLDAMKRAVDNLTEKPDFVLIDGFKNRANAFACPHLGVTGGDRKSLTIAAASIIAKVVRDEMMDVFDGVYDGYHLARNKGYGTPDHYRALQAKGPSPLHRQSFNLGARAEAI
jgi:ribonuclease HII